MHISLDAALQRQPLLSTVGDKLLPTFPGAAAAYSLRALNGDANNVVNVRRDADNEERDFTAEGVALDLEDWVNGKQETTLPADVLFDDADVKSFTLSGHPTAAFNRTYTLNPATGSFVGADGYAFKRNHTGNVDRWTFLKNYVRGEGTEGEATFVGGVLGSYPWNTTFTAVGTGDATFDSSQGWVMTPDRGEASAAYSLRKVRNAYTGDAVQIRRATDNVEVNVAFDSNGEVSNSSAISNVTESPDRGDTTATTLGEFIVGNENNIVDFSSGSNDLFSHGDGTSIKFLAYGNSLSRTAYNHLTDSESIGASPSVTSDYSFRLDTRATGGYNPTHGITFRPLVKKYAYSVTFKYYIPEGQPNLQIIYGTKSANLDVQGAWTEVTVSSSASQGHRDVLLRSIAHSTTGGLWYIADLRMNLSAFDTYVVTWYDQSGNSNDATQPTTASQPKIAEGGSLLEALEFDSTDDFLSLTNTVSFENLPLSMFSVQDAQPTHNHHTMGCANSRGVGVSGNTVQYFFTSSTATLTFDSTISGLNLYSAIHDGTTDADNITAHRNGVANSSSSGSGMGQLNSSTVWTNIGVRANTNDFFHGTIKELIVFNSDQSANRFKIESNINNHYGLYNTAHDGFVETWYDQSGNGNDAVQTYKDYQPKIVDAGALVSGGILIGSGQHLSKHLSGTTFALNNASSFVLGAANGGQGVGALTTIHNLAVFSNPYRFSNTQGFRYGGESASSQPRNQSIQIFTLIGGSTTAEGFANGTSYRSKTSSSSSYSNPSFKIGSYSGNLITGKIQEVIIYDSDQSANRPAIEANINNQYSIY